jgi:predicted NUDIX family NTP pyrophosphohydrolase
VSTEWPKVMVIFVCPACGYWYGQRDGLWSKPQRCSACAAAKRTATDRRRGITRSASVRAAPMCERVEVVPSGPVEAFVEAFDAECKADTAFLVAHFQTKEMRADELTMAQQRLTEARAALSGLGVVSVTEEEK